MDSLAPMIVRECSAATRPALTFISVGFPFGEVLLQTMPLLKPEVMPVFQFGVEGLNSRSIQDLAVDNWKLMTYNGKSPFKVK
jgi:hypothetical protein